MYIKRFEISKCALHRTVQRCLWFPETKCRNPVFRSSCRMSALKRDTALLTPKISQIIRHISETVLDKIRYYCSHGYQLYIHLYSSFLVDNWNIQKWTYRRRLDRQNIQNYFRNISMYIRYIESHNSVYAALCSHVCNSWGFVDTLQIIILFKIKKDRRKDVIGAAAARLWNDLPPSVTNASSISGGILQCFTNSPVCEFNGVLKTTSRGQLTTPAAFRKVPARVRNFLITGEHQIEPCSGWHRNLVSFLTVEFL